jgi:hypothetical protein
MKIASWQSSAAKERSMLGESLQLLALWLVAFLVFDLDLVLWAVELHG